jgi:hypothetical protein
MDVATRLQPGQHELTKAQAAAASEFIIERLRRQPSTEPVDEDEAERLLRRAHRAIGRLAAPRISWVDSPLQLQTLMPRGASWQTVFTARVHEHAGASVWRSLGFADWPGRVRAGQQRPLWRHLEHRFLRSMALSSGIATQVARNITHSSQWRIIHTGVMAYATAHWLACFHFSATYLAPYVAHALAQFNERVSGYWLGQELALLVRRPTALSLDAEGRLHSATSKCIEYRDGWGFYAWHGVRAPEQVILTNVEARRVIQERMGARFVEEVGGMALDSGPRGTLYAVELPGDPERVAHYAQVRDTSTGRMYYLRVPTTIQSVEAASPGHSTSTPTTTIPHRSRNQHGFTEEPGGRGRPPRYERTEPTA